MSNINTNVEDIIPFSKDEFEILLALSMGMKSNSRSRILIALQKKHESNPSDEKSAISLAIAIYLLIGPKTEAIERAKAQVSGYMIMSECLKIHSTWWLPRYLRSEISLGIPDGLAEMSSGVHSIGASIVKPYEDREVLIEMQGRSVYSEPYFMCPYMGQVREMLGSGNIDGAYKMFKRACDKVECKPTYHTRLLSQVFLDVIIILKRLCLEEFALQVQQKAMTVFPKSRSIAESINMTYTLLT
jgi:hypothetical protein